MTGHLYGFLQLPLVICTGACHSPGHDLAPLGDKLFQHPGVFIVDGEIGILAEPAHPFSRIYPFLLTVLRS